MKKSDYLGLPHVASFIEYFRHILQGKPFPHSYTTIKSGQPWSCNNLRDALTNYQWKIRSEFSAIASGNGFHENKQVLDSLAQDLRSAYRNNESTSLTNASKLVMKWGGTERYNNSFLETLEKSGQTIPYFKKASEVFDSNTLDEAGLVSEKIRSNAGFTKIYSLLWDNFIIYDSRVAAALALIVIDYCREHGLSRVPSGLAFRTMPAKESASTSHRKLRNPNFQEMNFQGVNNDSLLHARSNVMANWVLTEALDGICFYADAASSDLRSVEAALFMIGYDLSYSAILSEHTSSRTS